MKNLLLLLIITTQFLQAQKKIQVLTKNHNNKIEFLVENSSDFDQDVTLTISSDNIKSKKVTINKLVASNSKLSFYFLNYKTKSGYKTSYNYKKKPSKKQIELKKKELTKRVFKSENDDINKGIILFAKKGCSRCELTEDYFLKEKIKFKIVHANKNTDGNKLMWQLLKMNKQDTKSITMPVLLINGKLSHSHKNLIQFFKKI